MTAAAKLGLFAIMLMHALYFSQGYSTTASYEELLAAVKSGSFTVKKADMGKATSHDIVQELLDKSEFCFYFYYSYPVLVGETLFKHIKLKTLVYTKEIEWIEFF